jgi:hypothetical protein
MSIWWYIDHDHTGWSNGCPLLTRKCPSIFKTVEIPINKSQVQSNRIISKLSVRGRKNNLERITIDYKSSLGKEISSLFK